MRVQKDHPQLELKPHLSSCLFILFHWIEHYHQAQQESRHGCLLFGPCTCSFECAQFAPTPQPLAMNVEALCQRDISGVQDMVSMIPLPTLCKHQKQKMQKHSLWDWFPLLWRSRRCDMVQTPPIGPNHFLPHTCSEQVHLILTLVTSAGLRVWWWGCWQRYCKQTLATSMR